MPTTPQVPLNPTATQPHWLPLVEQCARERTTARLPKLDSELGAGRYKLKGDRLKMLPRTHYRYRLLWLPDGGKSIVLGYFDGAHSACPMETVVEDERYRETVELCLAQNGSIVGIPGLEHLLGAGSLKSEPGDVRKDGNWWCILYWKCAAGGSYVRLGGFALSANPVSRPKSRAIEKRGSLTMGHDELGRRIIRCGSKPNSETFIPIAVEYELIKGEWMPKPTHDRVAQAFRVG